MEHQTGTTPDTTLQPQLDSEPGIGVGGVGVTVHVSVNGVD